MWSFFSSALPYLDKYGPWFIFSCILCAAYYIAHMRERRSAKERTETWVDIVRQNTKSNECIATAMNGISKSLDDAEATREHNADKLLTGINALQERIRDAEVDRAHELTQILEAIRRP